MQLPFAVPIMFCTLYACNWAALNLLWLTSACGIPSAAAASPDSAATALHVDGAKLKDATGKAILLRGINHPGFVDAPDGAWDAPGKPLFSGIGHWDPAVIKGALDEYHQLGFNVLRFHTVVEWWKENPRSYKDPWRSVTYPQPYRQMLKDTIQWAGERGLYVIFDFFAMKNIQGKQSGQETLPWAPYNRYPDVVGSRVEFLAIWKSVAQELAPFPNVLFELYNEPNGNEKAEAEWFAFCEQALPAIRAYAANPVIIQWDYQCWVNLDYPPPQGRASTLAWIERYPLTGDNIIYGTHLYRNSGGGGPGAIHRSKNRVVNLWEAKDIRQGLELALFLHTVRELKKPLLVTELGAYLKYKGQDRSEELSHELLWFKNTLATLNRWGIGYVDWAWQSDEHLEHGTLHHGRPNQAGQIFLDSLKPLADGEHNSHLDSRCPRHSTRSGSNGWRISHPSPPFAVMSGGVKNSVNHHCVPRRWIVALDRHLETNLRPITELPARSNQLRVDEQGAGLRFAQLHATSPLVNRGPPENLVRF